MDPKWAANGPGREERVDVPASDRDFDESSMRLVLHVRDHAKGKGRGRVRGPALVHVCEEDPIAVV